MSTYTFGLNNTVDETSCNRSPGPQCKNMTVKRTLLIDLQDLLRFRVGVGLSILRNVVFVRLCRLVDQDKELIHGDSE